MKRPPTFLHNFFWRGGAVLGFMLAGTADAHAYVDPGTGAMILQIIGAIIAGALFYFRALRDKISSWFSRSKDQPDAAGKDEKP